MEGKDWSKRTRYCGTLRPDDVGREVTLNGWVQRRRDHGGVIFIDLRDVTGLVQVVFNPEINGEAHAAAGEVRGEYVLSCRGKVRPRPEDSINLKLASGEVEVMAEELCIITTALTPPFEIQEESGVDEALRLRYRYLDIRRPDLRDSLILRSRVTGEVRNFLASRGFLEIETPILTKSTPKGHAISWCPPACSQASFTLCRNRHSCSSSCSWWRGSTATTRSRAASVTRTCVPTASSSSPR